MANKKPNEVSGWKSELAALDSLPGETILDKKDKWQELHSRLQQKQGRKKAVWYWAAASIVILLGTSLWLMNKSQSIVAPALTLQPPVKKVSTPNILPTTDTKATVTDLSIQTPTKPARAASQKRTNTTLPTIQTPQPIVVAETAMIAKVVAPTALSVDTLSVAVAPTALPAKPKLKVVHVNELSDPGLFGPKLSTGDNYMVKEGRLFNRPVYSTSSPGTNQIRFNISSSKN